MRSDSAEPDQSRGRGCPDRLTCFRIQMEAKSLANIFTLLLYCNDACRRGIVSLTRMASTDASAPAPDKPKDDEHDAKLKQQYEELLGEKKPDIQDTKTDETSPVVPMDVDGALEHGEVTEEDDELEDELASRDGTLTPEPASPAVTGPKNGPRNGGRMVKQLRRENGILISAVAEATAMAKKTSSELAACRANLSKFTKLREQVSWLEERHIRDAEHIEYLRPHSFAGER